MKIFNYLLSTRAMALLLLLMAISIGAATFVENTYDTITAKVLIYNAKWFELILLLLVLNFINNVRVYNLWQLKKWSLLLLHFGFIIALIGSFVTRYIGYEGVMLIQENDSSQHIYSSEPYFQLKVHNDSIQYNSEQQHYFSAVFTDYPSSKFDFPGKGTVNVKVIERIENAKKEFSKDVPGGKLYLHLVLPGREDLYIPAGTVVEKQGIPYALNTNERLDAIRFYYSDGKLEVFAPFEINKIDMSNLTVEDRQKGMAKYHKTPWHPQSYMK